MSGDRMVATAIVGLARLLSGSSVRWVGCMPSSRQRVYYANHSSHLDAVILWAALPQDSRATVRPVAAADYWERSSLRRYLATHVFNAVLIARPGRGGASGQVRAGARAIAAMLEGLGDRYSLIIFPEGTRGTGGDIQPFRAGLYHLAKRRPDVEFIPVYMENLNRILPKGEFLPVPFLGSVSFGGAIQLAEDESRDDFLLRAREAVVRLGNAYDA